MAPTNPVRDAAADVYTDDPTGVADGSTGCAPLKTFIKLNWGGVIELTPVIMFICLFLKLVMWKVVAMISLY
jgi:hypothetical protein